jgi:hypothetical protein
MIDGREHVSSHGTGDMPVFGLWFRIPDDEVSIETEWADLAIVIVSRIDSSLVDVSSPNMQLSSSQEMTEPLSTHAGAHHDESTISHDWFRIFSPHAGIPNVGF